MSNAKSLSLAELRAQTKTFEIDLLGSPLTARRRLVIGTAETRAKLARAQEVAEQAERIMNSDASEENKSAQLKALGVDEAESLREMIEVHIVGWDWYLAEVGGDKVPCTSKGLKELDIEFEYLVAISNAIIKDLQEPIVPEASA